MGNFFDELKRRKVFRAAAVYIVTAWLLIQVVDVVLPTFGAPEWVNQSFIFLFVIGFPVVLIFAWIADSGSTSARVEKTTPSAASPQPINYIILIAVVGIGVMQVTDRFIGENSNNSGEDVDAPVLVSSGTPTRTNLNLGDGVPSIYTEFSADLSIAPDGSFVVYSLNDGSNAILKREFSELEPEVLNQGGETSNIFGKPVVSPDGENILFIRPPSGLSVISSNGGPVRNLTNAGTNDIDGIGGWSWLDSETPIYVGADQSINSFPLEGDKPVQLLAGSDKRIRWPTAIPGTEFILYNVIGGSALAFQNSVEILNIVTGETELFLENAINAQYVNSGHILFARDSDIWAVPFDLEAMEFTGPQTIVVQDVSTTPNQARSWFSVSDSGRLVYLPTYPIEERANRIPVWVDRSGNETALSIPPAHYSNPRFSPDGSRISIIEGVYSDFNRDIYVWDIDNQVFSQLTFLRDITTAIWSLDGEYLYFLRAAPQTRGMWRVRADGSQQPEQVFASPMWNPPMFIEESTQELFYISGQGTVNNSLNSVTLANEQQFETILPARDMYEATLSPDKNWLAVAMREGGGAVDIFAMPYQSREAGGRRLVARDARDPIWSQAGDEIFYISLVDRSLEYARVVSESPFVAERGGVIAEDVYYSIGSPPNFDASADGERFMVIRELEGGRSLNSMRRHDVVVVDNWFAELLELSPVDNQTN